MTKQELRGLRKCLDRQGQDGNIIKSHSSAEAPILLVKKPNGSFRMYIDYRALNKVIVKHRYLLTLMTELWERLNKARIFTNLDLKK